MANKCQMLINWNSLNYYLNCKGFDYLENEHVKLKIIEVYRECNIKSFPIECFELLKHYDLKYFKYSELSEGLKNYCMEYSEESLIYENKVCYNENKPQKRIRFSLMHELGHILLEHGDNPTEKMEQEANYFASNILAPRMAIHYAGCQNCNDVSKLFEISLQAADIAFNDYRRWRRLLAYYKMNSFDKAMYIHFYNKKQEKFIWSIGKCDFCGKLLYNLNKDSSHVCSLPKEKKRSIYLDNIVDEEFLRAEHHYLYGDCY